MADLQIGTEAGHGLLFFGLRRAGHGESKVRASSCRSRRPALRAALRALALTAAMLSPRVAASAPPGRPPQPPFTVVSTQGRALVQEGDLTSARQDAIDDALVRAAKVWAGLPLGPKGVGRGGKALAVLLRTSAPLFLYSTTWSRCVGRADRWRSP